MDRHPALISFFGIVLAATLLIMSTPTQVRAAISLSPTTPYTQNFDSLGTSATATLSTDWRVDKQTSVRTLGVYATALMTTERTAGNSMASNAANGIYNYAAGDPATATDRAVGFLSSGTATKSGNLYVHFTNGTGGPLTGLQISYQIEKYRNGSNLAGFSVQLHYSNDGIIWTSAGANFLTSFAADANNDGFAAAPGVIITVR